MRVPGKAAIAALCCLTACATPVHFGGEYHPRAGELSSREHKETLVKEDRWIFFWGLLDDGPLDVHGRLDDKCARGEYITGLTYKQTTTVLGLILSYFTLGIVSEQEVEVTGRRTTPGPHRDDLRPPAAERQSY